MIWLSEIINVEIKTSSRNTKRGSYSWALRFRTRYR